MRKNSETKRQAAILGEYGILLGSVRAEQNEPRLFLCAVRGLLIFFAVFGTLGGLVSAFDLEYNRVGVAALLFAISMFIAFIYYNRLTFYAGYVFLLIGFAWFSARYFAYINSGYQAFLNTAAKAYGSFFRLSSLREAAEIIENRYLTVSAVMIFLGAMLALLLNISISAYMSLLLTFLITFLPLQVAFYVNRTVPLPFLMMLIAVYISVMVLKRSGNFALPSKYGKEHVFEMRRKGTGSLKTRIGNLFSSHKEEKTVYKYLVSGSGMITVAGYSAVIAASFMLIMNGILIKTAKNDQITNTVKTVTDEYVKTIAQGGISALFNRYDSTGGLSRGQLGGVGSVNPDFETDLVVRFVPYSSDSLYLRAYLGKSYADNRFWPNFEPGGEEGSYPRILDTSGSYVYESGWGDDNYLPVIAGNGSDEPVKLRSFSPTSDRAYGGGRSNQSNESYGSNGSDLSNQDNGNSQSNGSDDDPVMNDSPIMVSGDHVVITDVDDTIITKLLVANSSFLFSLIEDRKNAGDNFELSNTDLAYLLMTVSGHSIIDRQTASQLGWDRFAKFGIVNVDTDRSFEYVPYYAFTLGRVRNEKNEVFSTRWKTFHDSGSVVGDYIYRGFGPADTLLSAPDGLEELKTEYEGLDSFSIVSFPYEASGYYQPNPTITSDYEDYVYSHYLDVPDDMRETLYKVAKEAGIDSIAEQAETIRNKYQNGAFSYYSEITGENSGYDTGTQKKLLAAHELYIENVRNMYDHGQELADYGLIDEDMVCKKGSSDPSGQLKKMNLYVAELIRSQTLRSVFLSLSRPDESTVLLDDIFDIFSEMVEKQVEQKPVTGYECAADEVSYEDYLEMQRLRLQLLGTLKNFYMREFSYTMSPGRTPGGKDVIDYFLTSRRRGFCAHFASSACLLLRSVGIPARYVEGYVIHPEDVYQGKPYDNDTSGWKSGDYGFPGSAVMDVEVSDASAHAWIEVYIDGHGWIPYEMTPPSDQEEPGGGLFGFLSNIITGRQSPQSRYVENDLSGTDGSGQNTDAAGEKSISDGIGFILIPLAWLIVIFATAVVLTYVLRHLIYSLRLKDNENKGFYSEALLIRYRRMLRQLGKKGVLDIANPTATDVADRLAAFISDPDRESLLPELAGAVNSAAFAPGDIDRQTYEKAHAAMSGIMKGLKKG